MFSKKSPHTDLPWLANDSLESERREQLVRWLSENPDAQLELEQIERVARTVSSQPQVEPPSRVLRQLHALVKTSRSSKENFVFGQFNWLWTVLLTVSVFLVLWGVAQPAMVMRWTVQYGEWEAFQIYRASSPSSEFKLIAQVAAQPGMREYTFSDVVVPIGREYVYQIEGLNTAGGSGYSEIILGNAIELVPVWILLVVVSLFAGISFMFVIRRSLLRLPSVAQAAL